jgi:hypothetical protein
MSSCDENANTRQDRAQERNEFRRKVRHFQHQGHRVLDRLSDYILTDMVSISNSDTHRTRRIAAMVGKGKAELKISKPAGHVAEVGDELLHKSVNEVSELKRVKEQGDDAQQRISGKLTL